MPMPLPDPHQRVVGEISDACAEGRDHPAGGLRSPIEQFPLTQNHVMLVLDTGIQVLSG